MGCIIWRKWLFSAMKLNWLFKHVINQSCNQSWTGTLSNYIGCARWAQKKLNYNIHYNFMEKAWTLKVLGFKYIIKAKRIISVNSKNTVLTRSDTMATIYFITQFCAASIREQLLFESSVY